MKSLTDMWMEARGVTSEESKLDMVKRTLPTAPPAEAAPAKAVDFERICHGLSDNVPVTITLPAKDWRGLTRAYQAERENGVALRRELNAEKLTRPPLTTWRGYCGHLWDKKFAEDCPTCAAIQRAEAAERREGELLHEVERLRGVEQAAYDLLCWPNRYDVQDNLRHRLDRSRLNLHVGAEAKGMPFAPQISEIKP